MEIGSEFWLENEQKTENKMKFIENKNLFLSGRTAIEYALQTIENTKEIKTAYFPSYCCTSMLLPFQQRNIKIEFYTVTEKNGELKFNVDINKKCDIFFAMNYFGFSKYNMERYIIEFKKNGAYVIEDSTHSILSTKAYSDYSDFIVASLRKWFPIISGGICISKISNNQTYNITNEKYVEKKKQAMLEKSFYIKHKINNSNIKDSFISKFGEANKILNEDYQNFKIDEESYNILKTLDISNIIIKRRENVKVIYNYLTNQQLIGYLKDVDLENDCPIFVPIFMENRERDKLREYLIKNNVYCPNHWPIPEMVKENKMKEIYTKELSLVCDQRYNEKQIKKYIKMIETRS